jgi:hypothetical protein
MGQLLVNRPFTRVASSMKRLQCFLPVVTSIAKVEEFVRPFFWKKKPGEPLKSGHIH